MSGLRTALACLLIASTTLAAGPASAETASFCPMVGEKVDASRPVDKDDLAGAALDAGGMSRPFERRAGSLRLISGLTLRQTLIVRNQAVCGDGPNHIACSDAERTALIKAFNAFLGYLADTTSYQIAIHDDRPAAFFADRGSTLSCKADPAIQIVDGGSAGPTESGTDAKAQGGGTALSFENIRVRGSAADLIFPRGTSGFAAADKAQLAFGDDKEAGKKTTKFVGTLGYAFALQDSIAETTRVHTTVNLIPYYGINLDTAKKKGEDKSVSSDTMEVGAVFELLRAVPFETGDGGFGHNEIYVAISPRVLFNRDDRSRLGGLNFLYRPSFDVVNTLHPIGNSRLFWNVLADLRWNNGTFLRQGSRTDETSPDFSRIGGRLGLGFATKGGPIPAEFTVTDTYMVGLAGEPGHLNLFKTVLSLYFHEKKYFGIDFGYSRGRYEDLDPREEKWTIAFAVKY